jgi:hypothetical protein
MSENKIISSENRPTKILAFGAIIGALVGIGAAYLILQRVDDDGKLQLGTKEGVKLGISIFSFFRQITQLGD